VREVLDALDAWLARGERAALATVVETQRSAPQPPGAKMALASGGQVAGAVSGGCVEGAVVEVAERVLAGAAPELHRYGIADEEAWDVGLPCGGELAVWIQAFDPAGPQGAFASLVRDDGRGALVTLLAGGPSPGAALLVDADRGTTGTLGAPALDAAGAELAHEAMWTERRGLHEVAGATLFVDAIAPKPRLIVFGAVDFAAQLSALATVAGWRTFVVDPRSRFATAERFPAAERVIDAWPEEALAQLGGIDRATSIAVLTHDPKLDDAALLAALRSEAAYVGAMGSRRAQARRRERLLAAGLEPEALDRLAAPIGLDLGAVTAEETAVSILGELIAVRRGRTGGRLADARGRVHEAV